MSWDGPKAKTKDQAMETGKLTQSVAAAKVSFWDGGNAKIMTGFMFGLAISALIGLGLWSSFSKDEERQRRQDARELRYEGRTVDIEWFNTRLDRLEQMVGDLEYVIEKAAPLTVSADAFCSQEDRNICVPHLVGPIYNYRTGYWEPCPLLIRHGIGVIRTPLEDACFAESLGGNWNRRFFLPH